MRTFSGKLRFVPVLLFLISTANLLAAQVVLNHGQGGNLRPDGKGGVIEEANPASATQQAGPTGQAVHLGNGINYNGGPVMKGNPAPIYLIWYGNWNSTGSNTAATRSLVELFVGCLGNTPYELINTTYGDSTGDVSGNVSFGGSANNISTSNLTDAGVQNVVASALNSGVLPRNANGLYFVLTSSGVNETSGFCTQYCGWHTHATLGGVDIKYSFVGNPDRCPSACELQTTGPNSPAPGVGGADGIVNQIAFQQNEMLTDPDLNAWFDSSGTENSGKCFGKLGATQSCSPLSTCKFNVTFCSHNWLLQENWINANGGSCGLHL
jgi:hypothetical protein